MVERNRRKLPVVVARVLVVCAIVVVLGAVAVSDNGAVDDDLNGDGVGDRLWTDTDRGSGWGETRSCAIDGLSGDRACRVVAFTAYSRFSGVRLEMEPPVDNEALPLLPDLRCGVADASRPDQGAMGELAHVVPLYGEVTVVPRWRDGPSAAQADVCMSVDQASVYPSGLGWDASGGAVAEEPGWSVLYSASVPLLGGPGLGTVVAESGQLSLVQWGHALAVYDRATSRHAWLLNLADGTRDGFKVDRWHRLERARLSEDGLVEVQVRGLEGARTLWLTFAGGPLEP